MAIELKTPISEETAVSLKIGDTVLITGYIFCGRDAVLPKVVELIDKGDIDSLGIELQGSIIFHTAVSLAGVGPTSSNKLEIESSIEPLSKAGENCILGKEQSVKRLLKHWRLTTQCMRLSLQ